MKELSIDKWMLTMQLKEKLQNRACAMLCSATDDDLKLNVQSACRNSADGESCVTIVEFLFRTLHFASIFSLSQCGDSVSGDIDFSIPLESKPRCKRAESSNPEPVEALYVVAELT